MKTPVFAFCAVFATATIAESQTANIPAAAPVAAAEKASAAGQTDEIDLEDGAGGKVELTSVGQGDDQLVNIICEDATISEILRQFRRVVRANIISSDSTNLSQRVSISLYDAPWLDSLKSVVGMGGFAIDNRNGIYFVTEERAEDPVIRTKSIELNHASADDMAKLLNESFGTKDKRTGKVTENVASVFKDANVVVVKGNDKMIRDCEEVIKTVDKAPEQVYIEARFIELSTAAMHKLGINWQSLENYKVEAKNLKFGVENNWGKLGNYKYTQPNNSRSTTQNSSWSSTGSSGTDFSHSSGADGSVTGADGNNRASSSSSTSSGSDSYTRGSTMTSLVPDAIPSSVALLDTVGGTEQERSMQWKSAGAFSGQLSADNFSLALSAFEQMSDVKMFSNPRIIVSNGKEAKVDMTTKYPNVRVTSNRTGGISDSLDITAQLEQIPGEDGAMFAKEVFFSWGISLSVVPRISPDGLINVEIIPMISDRSDWAEVKGGEGSAYSKYPVIDVQRLVTDFTMKDGSTAVIGGLTRTQEQDVDSGIPYLRKIPWIGPKLFGWKGREKVQREIVVFVTVGVANPRKLKKDVGLPKNAVLAREYIEGRELEPGDRGGKAKALELDMRDVVDRAEEDAEKPVEAAEPAKEAKPEEEEPAASGPTKNAKKEESAGPMKKTI